MIRPNQALAATGIALSISVADQVLKALVVARMALHQTIPLIPGCLSLSHRRNVGIAFSLFSEGGTLRTVILILIGLVALALLGALILRSESDDRAGRTALALVAGGAVGNLVDRIRLGYVVDYIDAYLGAYHWPTFNLADSAIVVGVAAMLLLSFWPGKKSCIPT